MAEETYTPNDPKYQALAERLALKARSKALSWRMREDGTFALVLVAGPKLSYTAAQVKNALRALSESHTEPAPVKGRKNAVQPPEG